MPRFLQPLRPTRWACLFLAFFLACPPLRSAAQPDQTPLPSEAERTLGPQPTDPDTPVVPPDGPEDSWGYAPAPGADPPAAATEDGEASSSVEIVRARRKGELGHRWVQSIERFEPGAARAGWSAQGDKVAFDAPGDLGFRAVYVRDLDSGSRKCLTCDLYQLRQKSVLSPVWHPSGDWLLVTVQDLPRRLLPDPVEMVGMHRALHADLWILSSDGKGAWQLSRSSDQGGATLEAKISHEGDRVAWSERVDSTEGLEGSWVLRVATLDLRKVPSLENDKTYRPTSWPARITVEGFAADDGGVWLSMTPPDRHGSRAARYDLASLRLELLDTSGGWDLEARTVPRGERIVLASDRGLAEPRILPWVGDLWFVTPLGLRQERLTFFNDPHSDHRLGEALIADLAWAPDGRSVLLSIVSTEAGAPREALWRVDLSSGLQGDARAPG